MSMDHRAYKDTDNQEKNICHAAIPWHVFWFGDGEGKEVRIRQHVSLLKLVLDLVLTGE